MSKNSWEVGTGWISFQVVFMVGNRVLQMPGEGLVIILKILDFQKCLEKIVVPSKPLV
jgi:hypothetical protein